MSQIRVNRKEFIVPRCTDACPAGVDVPRYIRAVKNGAYDEAVAVLREKIPFPVVCADACFAPCEDVCAYRQIGDPIAIRALKRAAVDKSGDTWKQSKKQPDSTGMKVAVIGAGPAGLTAAYYLNAVGHDVTVCDTFSKPGGAMRYGIPAYRVPEERLDRDINDILEQGVTFKGNTEIGNDITMPDIKKEYDAVFISSGANSSARIPVEGSEKEGVLWGWEFLRDVSQGQQFNLGDKVVVIGGGNVAIDVALTARRLGAEKIDLFCLESREEMPAHPWEIAVAEEEGVFINNSWAPKKILGDGEVTGLGLMKCTSVFDNACNFNPVYDDDITHKIEADTIILAVGQSPILQFIDREQNIKNERGRVMVDEESLATGEDGVFAGGDVVTGPASIISAIAQGRRAAEAIDKHLGGSGDISETLAKPEEEVWLPEFSSVVRPRNELGRLKVWERTKGFEQVELALTDEQIQAEASRCLNCDARKFEVILNTENCKECGYCVEVCDVDTFGPAATFNSKGYKPMECKSSDWCVGCLKCFFSCPDFAIDVKEVRS